VPAAVRPVRVWELPVQLAWFVGGFDGVEPASHCEWLHAHDEQLSPAGPSHVPAEQTPLDLQKPHPVAAVHPPHALNEPQLPHWLFGPNCHEGHMRFTGPVIVPGSHVLVVGHHPHPVTAAHEEHVRCGLHVDAGGTGDCAQSLAFHFQSVQVPDAGPR